MMRSREFTEGFIRDGDLLPRLFYKRWDAAAGRWQGPQEKWPTLAQGYRFFDQRVRQVSRDKVTGLITLDIEWRDPQLAAQWANDLVARLNAEMRERAIKSSDASVGFLQDELTRTNVVDTRLSINRLLESQINRRMLANVTQDYALRVVGRALPPERDEKVSPKRGVMLVLGAALGLICGMLWVLLLRLARRPSSV